MDGNTFYNAWKTVCSDNEDAIIQAWDSGKWKQYTDLFLGKSNQNSILVLLQQELKLEIYQEYYSCDAVFYKSSDCLDYNDIEILCPQTSRKTPPIFNQTWLKKIRIHFEHENDIRTSWKEMMQFCVIPGELNVLVTYPNDKDESQNALNCYNKILCDASFRNNVLIIFGTHAKGSTTITWDGYLFESNKFNKIKLDN